MRVSLKDGAEGGSRTRTTQLQDRCGKKLRQTEIDERQQANHTTATRRQG